MACGDKYRGLAVTVSGLNFENPWDNLATVNDYGEWRDLAVRLAALAQTAQDALGNLEGAPFTRWNANVETQNAMVDAIAALPQALVTLTPEADIAEAQAAIGHALCLLERANDAIAELGGTPIDTPVSPAPREDTGPFGIGNIPWGAVAIIGVALLVLTRRR